MNPQELPPPPLPEPVEARPAPAPPERPAETPLPDQLDLKSLFEGLLRRPKDLIPKLGVPGHQAAGKLALLILVTFAMFGVVLGCFAKHEQLWAAPLKMSAGLLFSSFICFPSLYIFSALAGARMTVSQLAVCFAAALTVTGLLLLGFAPAIWIFAESSDSFGFIGALVLIIWLISLVFGFGFLRNAVKVSGGGQDGPMILWFGIFLLVTLQMSTSLRPILGRSDAFLTSEKRFFLQHWGMTMGTSLSPVGKVPSATTQAPEAGAQPAPSSVFSPGFRNPPVSE